MADREPSPTPLSSSQRRPHMSITLPRNFAPLGLDDGNHPRTPDQTFAELNLPPAPHHSTCRPRRSRLRMDNFQSRNNALPAMLFASDIPVPSSANKEQFSDLDFVLPSIELHTQLARPPLSHSITDPSPMDRLRISPFGESALPRTPIAQTKTATGEAKNGAWDMHRCSSASSLRSDSSCTSTEDTFTTRPTSFDGSTTSPEIDLQDPFSPGKVNIIPDTPSRKNKKLRINTSTSKVNVTWSIEMDNHLFNVYQMYLADPTVTPFKTVPGSIPPTGVCHRVARKAKETWPRASRVSKPIIQRYKMRNVIETRAFARDRTPEPSDTRINNDARGAWPSESATRKRLKQLCKEKFTITAHYQRLRESRSPSPFHEQFLRRPSSRLNRSFSSQDAESSTTYATRELGISLVASGATAPLAQLVTGDSPPTQQMSDDWFNTPVSNPDAMSISTPAGLGIDADPDRLQVAAGNIPRLASPFNYSTWNGSSNTNNHHRRGVSHHHFDTVHATGSRLLSPFKLEPELALKVNKRRALHNLEDELSPSGSHIQKATDHVDGVPVISAFGPELQPRPELSFDGAGDLSQRRIRIRSRGATLGAVNSRERIQDFFNNASAITRTPDGDSIPPVPPLPASLTALATPNPPKTSTSLALPEIDPNQKRLGSPFELDPNKRSYRSKAPRHVPSLSDPFIGTFATTPSRGYNPLSIGERLSMFNTFHPTQFPRDFSSAPARDDPFT
jgi:hypothetical protein